VNTMVRVLRILPRVFFGDLHETNYWFEASNVFSFGVLDEIKTKTK